ncbi:MAG: TonB-dependent receptor, partial [Sphingomonas sp.]
MTEQAMSRAMSATAPARLLSETLIGRRVSVIALAAAVVTPGVAFAQDAATTANANPTAKAQVEATTTQAEPTPAPAAPAETPAEAAAAPVDENIVVTGIRAG